MMEQDKADRLTDQVEQHADARCSALYTDALTRCMHRIVHAVDRLNALEAATPPAVYDTPEKQDEWREGERRRIIRSSGIANLCARELAAAGNKAAEVIKSAMADVDRINRVVDDIG